MGRAVLYADALKFLTTFRSQLPKALVVPTLPAGHDTGSHLSPLPLLAIIFPILTLLSPLSSFYSLASLSSLLTLLSPLSPLPHSLCNSHGVPFSSCLSYDVPTYMILRAA